MRCTPPLFLALLVVLTTHELHASPGCVTLEKLEEFRLRVVEATELQGKQLAALTTSAMRHLALLEAYNKCKTESWWCFTAERQLNQAKEEYELQVKVSEAVSKGAQAALVIYQVAQASVCRPQP
jgi:hypothetical protein